MDDISKLVDQAANADMEVKRKGGYGELLGSRAKPSNEVVTPPQPVAQNPLEKEIQEALAERKVAAARNFRRIESSASDPKPQGT